MKTKGIALIASLLVAMTLIGVGYAMWSETLLIDGTVNTGFIECVFEEGYSTDSEPEGKDVSGIVCVVSPDGKTLTVTVSNAYPCIVYENYFDIHCLGSVPVHIYGVTMLSGNPDWISVSFPQTTFPIQLHFCDRIQGVVRVHLDNSALQNDRYTFQFEINYYQWNEAPT